MARKTKVKKCSPKGLLSLPNEIFHSIAAPLSTLDLRRLSRVNKRLHSFVENYLVQHRYNSGLAALPNEIILEIVQQLDRQKDRSCLARASLRFYPLIMDYIYRYNVQYGGSGLLNYAAKRNLSGMTREMLRLGGDVNTQYGTRVTQRDKRLSPLAIAAFHGHERIIEILMKNGANNFVDGVSIPLIAAIFKRQESVARLLAKELETCDVVPRKIGFTPLQMACSRKLLNLVRYFLESSSKIGRNGEEGERIKDCSTALYCVLRADATRDTIIKRELLEDAYQIVLLLLNHGANPDMRIKTKYWTKFWTTATPSSISARHPDPRVRILLAKPSPVMESKEATNLPIGRQWMNFSGDENIKFLDFLAEAYSDNRQYATLSEFVGGSNARQLSSLSDEHEDDFESRWRNYESHRLNDSAMALLARRTVRCHGLMPAPTYPPPLSSFPQLSTPKPTVQDTSKELWASLPTKSFSKTNSPQTPTMSNKVPTPQKKEKQLMKPIEKEWFPQLGQPGSAVNDSGKDLWAQFSKDKASRRDSATQQTCSRGEENDFAHTVHKSSKKKWKKMSIW